MRCNYPAVQTCVVWVSDWLTGAELGYDMVEAAEVFQPDHKMVKTDFVGCTEASGEAIVLQSGSDVVKAVEKG